MRQGRRLLPLQLFGGAWLRPDRAGRHLCSRLPADRRGAALWHHAAPEEDSPLGHDRAITQDAGTCSPHSFQRRRDRRGQEIGSASCRERVCQYVVVSVVAGTCKKKTATML